MGAALVALWLYTDIGMVGNVQTYLIQSTIPDITARETSIIGASPAVKTTLRDSRQSLLRAEKGPPAPTSKSAKTPTPISKPAETPAPKTTAKKENEAPFFSRVLIVVITSHKEFVKRVGAIAETWGSPGNTRNFHDASVLYVVGEEADGLDIRKEAAEAGVDIPTQVLVMDGIGDDEYPPVYKNSGMIERVSLWVKEQERIHNEGKPLFDWMFKVDDDAYVNVPAMLDFIPKTPQPKSQNKPDYQIYGRRGSGRPGADRVGLKAYGMKEPYCMGGPGYIMTAVTWHDTAAGMQECLKRYDSSKHRDALWHSDVAIGICVQEQTGTGCWNRHIKGEANSLLFVHNATYQIGDAPYPEDKFLSSTISMHPFKAKADMVRQHKRYQSLKVKAPSQVKKTS